MALYVFTGTHAADVFPASSSAWLAAAAASCTRFCLAIAAAISEVCYIRCVVTTSNFSSCCALERCTPHDAAHWRGQRHVSSGVCLFHGSLADRIQRSSSAGVTASAAAAAAAAAAANCDNVSQALEENESLKAADESSIAVAVACSCRFFADLQHCCGLWVRNDLRAHTHLTLALTPRLLLCCPHRTAL